VKNILIIIFIFFGLFFSSCEDNLNPFFEKENTYILNCVLKNDKSFQTALLSKSYFVDNFDPSSYNEDQSINDAYIRIFFDDSVKIFKDTLLSKSDNSESSITSYFHNNFNTKPNTEYHLEAVLSDGRKISSTTTSPKPVAFKYTSDALIPPPNKSSIRVSWNSEEEKLYTAARFKFIYFKKENGIDVRYEKEVPRAYALENGEYKAYYPEPSYDNSITVEMNAFDRSLREISEGDPNKKDYTILAFILEILVYDKNLTAYYASKTELGESFSITTNESDFSNINGGRGIFGSYIKQRKAVKFTLDYIHSFGYTPGLTE
jgi:hypothetical protein